MITPDNRYLAFAYESRYPSGGPHDMVGQYATQEQAEDALEAYSGYQVREIYDTWAAELWEKVKPQTILVADGTREGLRFQPTTPTEYTLMKRREVDKS